MDFSGGKEIVEFRILGPLEVSRDGRPIRLGGRRQRALLAILLLHANEVVSLDRLVDDLWGERVPKDPAHSVQVLVSQLRRALEPSPPAWEILLSRPPGYMLRVQPGELDLHRVQRLLDEARELMARGDPAAASATLREALRWWRGPALVDLAYEGFAQPAIRRLEELRLAAIAERIEADLQLGRHDDVIGELEELIGRYPTVERLRGQLMLALYRSGRQGDALRVFQEARAFLSEHLGIEPSPALKTLQRAILRQDPDLQPQARMPSSLRTSLALEPSTPRRSILVVPSPAAEGSDAIVELATRLCLAGFAQEALVVQVVDGRAEALGGAVRLAEERRADLVARGVSARAAAFVAGDRASALARFASEQSADLILAPAALDPREDSLSDELHALLIAAASDVGLLVAGNERAAGPFLMVPFGGSEHDWAALEIAAWAAAAEGKALRLVGSGGEGPESKDASRLLANASLVVQRLVGVAVEPVLVEPSVQGLIEAAGEADLVVMGLPERWRSKGLGEVRAALARSLRSPVLLTKRGLSSVGIAPQRESLTRFTWTSPPVGGR